METGQLPASLGLDTTVSMLTGSLYAHYLNGQQLPDDWAEHALLVIWPANPTQPGQLSALIVRRGLCRAGDLRRP